MGQGCGHHHFHENDLEKGRFRRVLWAVLIINGVMFLAEFSMAFWAKSAALQADALDFLGDAVTYGVTLMVLNSALRTRAIVAMLKGISMGVLGLWVLYRAFYYMISGDIPIAEAMGVMGGIAFVANVVCAWLLFHYRSGDSNMQSVWLCSRNDALGNLAIIIAASGVFATGTGWPDFIVAMIMAGLAISASIQIVKQARLEMKITS